MRKIAYPGTFDPFHFGHQYIVSQLIETFDEVYILVFDNPNKKVLIEKEKRAAAIAKIFGNKIKIIASNKSLLDELNDNDINLLARGVRNSEDINIELQRSIMIKKLDKINTIFIPTGEKVTFLSSSIIKELLLLNKDISSFCDPQIIKIYDKEF